jgi:steroid 5-alpha reductase family enzyme
MLAPGRGPYLSAVSDTLADALPLALLGLLSMLKLMLSAWAIHQMRRNASWVDVGWAAGLGLLALLYATFGSGYGPRRLLVAVVAGAWSLRLTAHLLARVLQHPEDERYAEMRARWGGNLRAKFLALFLGQGVLDVVLAIPFLAAAVDPSPVLHPVTVLGALVAIGGMVGEATADAQLRAFKSDPQNRGLVCRVGLWGWSRHPNYFFDWVVWCGFALLGLMSPLGWLGVVSPVLMFYFLTRVTGVTATEAHALQSRGEAYARYQREVSAFFPRPPAR